MRLKLYCLLEALGTKLKRIMSLHLALDHGIAFFNTDIIQMYVYLIRAQWLSGRVLDSRPRGRGFEPHRRHCVVVLEQDTFILA